MSNANEASKPAVAQCDFDLSLAATDAHDPQSFINGARWALATCPTCGQNCAAPSVEQDERGALPLSDFREGQWWISELDAWAESGSDDQKRAVAVVHRLLRAVRAASTSANVAQGECGDCDARIRKWRDAFDAMHRRARNAEASVDDLSMLVRQLVHSLRKAAPDNALSDRAVDYLKRAGLAGSPLREAARETSANVAQGAEAVASLRRIAHELRTYNPAADEYKGEHIHKVWAREIEALLPAASNGESK